MEIKKYIKTPCRLFEFDTIDSTNNEAKRMLEADLAVCPFVIVANCQTAGRGRQGKSFYSPKDTGIYMSVAFEMENDCDTTFFTSAVAVAVSNAIDACSGKKTLIKWVNDIYLNDRKVCGILCESVFSKSAETSKKYIVSGIGINLSTQNFPDELKQTAVSLGEIKCSKNRLIAQIADNIFEIAKNTNTDLIFETYRKKSNVIGKNIRYLQNNIWYDGFAKDIDRDGSLVVETKNGHVTQLFGGEITLRVK